MPNSPDERIVALLRDARQQLELERNRREEPIAIVGIGCRFPGGVASPTEFWKLLRAGLDASGEVPADRWSADAYFDADPEAPGKAYTRRGSFLEHIDGFDADFFGISPREALGMDPQQRLLLEVVWEALEDGGIVPDRIRGTATGVWVGLCVDDYARRSLWSDDAAAIDAYSALGNTRSVAAGRISYVLDLRGPAVQLDTACSSSLVAVHQACQSLRARECNLALVGGVNLMSAPESTIALCKLRALSPDGRCKTFDAAADGYGRGEGCAFVALKRLSDARAAGDRIYAIVRGSAVNHDGHSNGLTAPNGLAQEAVLRAALANAGVEATDVSLVEAHGTGTLLGDPIEVLALGRVYGANRATDSPLQLGTVKTNFGHLEGAAGVAGLIKLALCLWHGELVPNLHFHQPNPKIPWSTLPVQVVTRGQAWPRSAKPRLAGVSSFGISGTNAHALLEEAPLPAASTAAPARSAEIVVLSAKSPEALPALARRLSEELEASPELALGDLAYSLSHTRVLLTHRVSLSVASRSVLLEALAAVAAGQTPVGGQRGSVQGSAGRLAWLFTGQGAQQLGMGRELDAEWPAFREAFAEVCTLFDPLLDVPLREVIWADSGSTRAALLDQTGFAQPALFALEWALACLWRSFGVVPDLLLGHSIGELTAAAVAGVFSLADAVRLVAARARLMQALPPGGAMFSIAAPEDRVLEQLQPFAGSISIAAVNAPGSVVISGAEAQVIDLAERLQAQGVRTKRLVVSHAFHSALMDPMLAAFEQVAESISYQPASLTLVSDTTGELAGPEISTAQYWVRHVRESVQFARGVRTLAQAGVDTLLELGPKPTLIGLVPACLPGRDPTLLASLRPARSEPEALFDAVGGWVVRGGELDWRAVFPAGGRRVALPTYPWQRQRYWLEPPVRGVRGGRATTHALLGRRLASAGADAIYETVLSPTEPAWLGDHRVGGQVVVPAAVLAELLRAAAEDYAEGAAQALSALSLQVPLLLADAVPQRVQIILSERARRGSVHSQPAQSSPGAAWTLHAAAELSESVLSTSQPVDLAAVRRRCSTSLDVPAFYAAFAAVGLEYGPAFRGVRELLRGPGEALARVELPEGIDAQRYGLHPALLDAALQAISGAIGAQSDAWLPFALDRLVVHRSGATRLLVHVQVPEVQTDAGVRADLALLDAAGLLVAEIVGLRLRRVDVAKLGWAPLPRAPEAFYQVSWQPSAELAVTPSAQRWLIVAQPGDLAAQATAEALRARGESCEQVSLEELAEAPSAAQVVCFWTTPGAMEGARRGLSVVQALAKKQPPPRLWWLTRGAVSVDAKEDVSPASAALWGLGRTVMTEHPELRCTLLDLGPELDPAEVLLREIGATDDENQVAWREQRRYVARLLRAARAPDIAGAEDFLLESRHKGALDSLALAPAARRAPRPGEVEIEVQASGLNFRDVLNALGMYPGEAGPLGGECSGVVTALGAGVSRVAMGERVMGLAAGSFRRFVTVDARWVTSVPPALSFEQAASIPIVFATAWYALRDLAELKRGERVLIHAAAGGVGMAALQLANWIGAEVLATASPGKWDALRALGVEHLASSRDTSFAKGFRASAGPADVVLNALAGDFIDASLSLLSAGGRFIEMGKADLRDPELVARAHPGVTYQAFDLAQLDPERIAQILDEVRQGLVAGHLKPLPLRTFLLSEAESAFRFMAQARHIGKIVLLPPRPAVTPRSTVLVTGGLGALGLAVARRLAERGVQHLLLTGRRGDQTPGAAQAIAGLVALGARVSVAAIDVADRAALARVLEAIPAELPLRGVVHAAGLVDDGLLLEQTPERFDRVLSPKVLGASHLDALTRGIPLDFFVLFSSLAGTLGSAAQGAYAAANAFLDALAVQRRAHGLPALSLAWGPWTSGMAAALDERLQARFARQGISMLSLDRGLSLLESALGRSEAQLVVVPLDLALLTKSLGPAVPALWRSLVRPSSSSVATPLGGWAREIEALAVEARLAAVTQMVRTEVARVLSLPSFAQVAADKPLQELGLDSLMAVELKNALSQRAGATLSATLAFDHPTPQAIAKYLLADVLRLAEPSRPQAMAIAAVAVDEAIAIVGIGCRFPGGVTDPESLWHLLERGGDAISEVPRDRWDIDEWYDPDPDALGKMTTRWGGFLPDLDRFEPSFFGISPREAVSIDPQERLLLETTWEALEHAGIRAETLMDSRTGVYMGLCGNEYQNRIMADAQAINAYSILGTAHSTIVGRLSYWLGLKGPNLSIDTACSSSLVAVHLACQALRDGECDLAFAGGANVILSPEGTVYFSRLRAMSPTGRCHTFSADADGYVRSEGAGVVVLERLSDALARGRRIFAIIRGSAVNQDGRSNGLTAPNGPSQRAVILDALRRGGIAPSRVGYVECHGTGTPLGDPIEVQALAAALSEGRSNDHPVVLGALKSNVGHMEGAAGVGGLIKAALSLQHGRIPKTLHFHRPNSHIPWDELPVRVANESMDWLRNGAPRVAGVSAFGISGTNAHLVLEEAPAAAPTVLGSARAAEIYVLSAKTSEALASTAQMLREHLEAHPEVALGDVAYSLVTTRSLHNERLSISVVSRSDLLDALQVAARGQIPTGAQRGTVAASSGKLAWLFTGQGAQQSGMGRELYAEWPAFREALDQVCALLDPLLEAPLRPVMWAEPGSARSALLDQTGFTQPALFAVEWALACLWRSWGVEPDLLLGHSIGQITAATVAGVFTLTDAVHLVAGRARLMQDLPAGGAMLSLAAAEAEVLESIQPFRQTVALAAVNGPASVVIAGKEADVSVLAERFESRGVPTKRLAVSHAFHSPLMDSMLGSFQKVAESITYHTARIPLVADTTGVLAGSEISTPEYWVRHVRETVRFAPAVEALARAGVDTFIELGPRPTLLGLVAACQPKPAPTLLATLRPSRSEVESALDALGGWVARGGFVEWKGVFPSGGRSVPLPTYPWQRQRYWMDDGARRRAGDSPIEIEALLRQLVEREGLPAGVQAALPDILTALAADRAATDPVAISSWFYKLAWRPIAPSPPPMCTNGGWGILGAGEDAETLRAALQRAGRRPYMIDLDHLSTLLESAGGLDGVVCVLSPSGDQGNQALALERVLALNRSAPRAWWVTRGAVGTSPEDAPTDLLQSVVWGLGRTFALEHPKTWGGLLDLPRGRLSDPIADRVVALLVGSSGEDQLAVRSDQVFVPRIVPRELDHSHSTPISGRGTALITGGLGALGVQVAQWLARRGVRHLLLVSRHGLSTPGALDAVAELQSLGVRVTVVAAHVADRDAIRQAIQGIALDAPLSSVFHLAGVSDFMPLDELTPERLANALSAKREGTLILDELTRAQTLEAFVCFSSIAGIWGAGGQAAYAAANAFLDAWAHAARAAGKPAYAISWGPWAGGGMADASARAQLERRGLYSMSPQLAVQALERVLSAPPAHTTIVHINWQLFRRSFEAWGPRSLLLEIGRDSAAPGEPNDASSWVHELSAVSGEAQRTFVVDVVRSEVARILSLPELERVPRDRRLNELGLDSLMLVELRSALSRRTGIFLSATLAFDQPSPESIAEHLVPEPFMETASADAGGNAASVDSPVISRTVAHCEQLSHLNAGSRLFCFHDAGGAASMFLPLIQMAGAGVEIHTISHNRLVAPLDTQRGRQYLKAAVEYVRGLSDRPYALFGHSAGALLAWRVVQEIVAGGGPQPLFFAPSGVAPVTPVQGFALDVSSIIDALFGARTGAVQANIASFRSDFATDIALWQMLPAAPNPRPLPVPIAAFLGSEDKFVTQPLMKTWGAQTTRDFSLTVLPGDHFYPYRKELHQALAKELGRAFFDASFSLTAEDELPARSIERERKVKVEP